MPGAGLTAPAAPRRFITGSYDRTCKVWNTNTGEEMLSLDDPEIGHKNVVYAIAFNNPFGDKARGRPAPPTASRRLPPPKAGRWHLARDGPVA